MNKKVAALNEDRERLLKNQNIAVGKIEDLKEQIAMLHQLNDRLSMKNREWAFASGMVEAQGNEGNRLLKEYADKLNEANKTIEELGKVRESMQLEYNKIREELGEVKLTNKNLTDAIAEYVSLNKRLISERDRYNNELTEIKLENNALNERLHVLSVATREAHKEMQKYKEDATKMAKTIMEVDTAMKNL